MRTLSNKYTRTYKTSANLEKALEKLDFLKFNPLMVYNEEGRVTAVFRWDEATSKMAGGAMMLFAAQGFMTL